MNFDVKVTFFTDEELYFSFNENEVHKMMNFVDAFLNNNTGTPVNIDIRCGNEEYPYVFEKPLPFN